MKKLYSHIFLILLGTLLASPLYAQLGGLLGGSNDEFPTVWEVKTSSGANVYSEASPDGNWCLTTSKTDISIFDCTTGKELWYGKFKDLTDKTITNSNYQVSYWDATTVLLFDTKMGKNDRIAAIDMASGKMLWGIDGLQFNKLNIEDQVVYMPELNAFLFTMRKNSFLIDAQSGEKKWESEKFRGKIASYIYMEEQQDLLLSTIPTGLLGTLTGGKDEAAERGNMKGTEGVDEQYGGGTFRINARSGEVKWSSEKSIVSDKMEIREDELYVFSSGLVIFDLETGKTKVDIDYNSTIGVLKPANGVNRVLKGKTYGAIATPLIDGDYAYVLQSVVGKKASKKNANKKAQAYDEKFITKVNLKTGEKVWDSEVIDDASAIPKMYKEGDRVVCQIGGFLRQRYKYRKGYGKDRVFGWIDEYDWIGPLGLVGIDAKTGKYVWRSERFKKIITDVITEDGNVYAASAKYFYSLKASDGEPNFEIKLEKKLNPSAKTEGGVFAFDQGNGITVIGGKGVTCYSKKDGSVIYDSDKIKKTISYLARDTRLFLQDNKDDLTLLDLRTGETLGTINVPKLNAAKTQLGKGFKTAMIGGKAPTDNLGEFYVHKELFGGADITRDGKYIFLFKGRNISKHEVPE